MSEALGRIGQSLTEGELAQARIQQWLERMGQWAAEEFHGAGIDEFAQQRTGAVTPQHGEILQGPRGLGVFAASEPPQRLRIGRSPGCGTGGAWTLAASSAQLPVGQPPMHAVQAVRVIELGGDHRGEAQGD